VSARIPAADSKKSHLPVGALCFALQHPLGGLPSPAMVLDCARTGLQSGFLHNFRRFS
jgi:hypothetical protein